MLQGTLNEFTLSDVFSLLALTKKSGALRVTADATDGRVFFRDGGICLALSDAGRVPLIARLVSSGLLGEEDLRPVVADHAGSSVAITDALLRSGQVEDRVLSVFLREQIVDAVFELMRLTEGCFSFDANEPGLSRGLTLGVIEVVGEANRRLDEWQTISGRIASPSAVLAMVPAAAAQAEGVTLAGEQWDLLALVDGRRTVADIVELTGQGEFATCRVLGDLVEAGLVEACDPASGTQTRLDKLIAAREALRSLERVEQPGIRPRLSSAAPLAPGGTAVRWIEPETSKQQPSAPVSGGIMASRSRFAEVQLDVDEPEAAVAVADHRQDESHDGLDDLELLTGSLDDDEPEAAAVPDTAAEVAPDPEPVAEAVVAEEPAPEPIAEPAAAAAPRSSIDRAQVVRELASLGLDDDLGPRSSVERPMRLSRDEEVNKGLLLRLIDGVKGA
jgi:hypothetical protein